MPAQRPTTSPDRRRSPASTPAAAFAHRLPAAPGLWAACPADARAMDLMGRMSHRRMHSILLPWDMPVDWVGGRPRELMTASCQGSSDGRGLDSRGPSCRPADLSGCQRTDLRTGEPDPEARRLQACPLRGPKASHPSVALAVARR